VRGENDSVAVYSSSIIVVKFSKTESASNTYSWSFSQTIEDSISVSVKVDIPEICEVHDEFSTTISTSTTETQSDSHSKSWSVEQGLNSPPASSHPQSSHRH